MNIPLLFVVLSLLSQPCFAVQVRCEDTDRSVVLNMTFQKKDSIKPPAKAVISNQGKTRTIGRNQILRFFRNSERFYFLFKVQTREGLHEIELDTRFNKNPRGSKTSAGQIINKTRAQRLNVTCWF